MEKVYFSLGKKGDVVCRTEGGKVSFIDRLFKGTMPQNGEEWAVEISKRLEKVNIVRPLFRVDSSVPAEKLVELGFALRLDFFNGELVVYGDYSYGKARELKRFTYDGRWDDRMFFGDYRFPEAIRLHKLSKEIVESGRMAIAVDCNGKLVQLSPGSVGVHFHEYGYYCHIHRVEGNEKNFVFVNQEAKEKWNQLLEKTKQGFLGKLDSPPADYWNSDKIAQAIGIPDRRKAEIPVPQKMIRASHWNSPYHEVIASAKTSWSGRPIEGETACQVCGSTSGAVDSEYTVYYEHRGSVGHATHRGLGKCSNCGAIQDQSWGKEGEEITDLPNFSDRDGSHRADWKTGEEEIYRFPYKDDDLRGELVVAVSPKIGATYLQKYKKWVIKSCVMHIFEVKRKCMRSRFIALAGKGDLRWLQIGEVNSANAEFTFDFTAAEKYVCGWLPQEYFYEKKEGGYSSKEIHGKICDYLADVGEYFSDDIPWSAGVVKKILHSMMAERRIDFLPSDEEIKDLHPLFLKDWISEGGKEEDFPSESEWKG